MDENNLLEKMLDNLIEEASCLYSESAGMSIEDESLEIDFSKEHELKMNELFKQERRKAYFKKAKKHSKRVAMFIFALLAVSGISIVSVSAWRIKVLNFIMEKSQTYSDIILKSDESSGTYANDDISFNYIPPDFVLDKSEITKNKIVLQFINGDDYFRFSQSSSDTFKRIDTEDATVKNVLVNGIEAIFSTNSNVDILLWHDNNEKLYMLSGNIGEKELVKIAENIEK